MKKILILMSDTGGGHRASADALRDAFNERYAAQLQVDMVDLWLDHTPPPFNRFPKGYRFLVDDLPWLWKSIYAAGGRPQATEPLLATASRLLSRTIGGVIRQHRPDLILSVHPLMQQIPLRVLRRMKRDTPFVTVVTDLINVHPLWYDCNVTLCFVPSQAAHDLALKAGLRPEQLRMHGLPIRPAFGRRQRPKAEIKRELGMLPGVPALLIVSGGEGMGRVGEIAQAVDRRLEVDGQERGEPVGQQVVICGRNQALEATLRAYPWSIPTVVKGYVDNIGDWMAACDCVVTKAGPGTIAEALALGLPIVLIGYIPGQETANVPYVLKNGVGVYDDDPLQVAEIISGWFGAERDVMAQFATRARQLGRAEAAFEIVDDIAALLQQRGTSPTSLVDGTDDDARVSVLSQQQECLQRIAAGERAARSRERV